MLEYVKYNCLKIHRRYLLVMMSSQIAGGSSTGSGSLFNQPLIRRLDGAVELKLPEEMRIINELSTISIVKKHVYVYVKHYVMQRWSHYTRLIGITINGTVIEGQCKID